MDSTLEGTEAANSILEGTEAANGILEGIDRKTPLLPKITIWGKFLRKNLDLEKFVH